MSVYVDDFNVSFGRLKLSHMIADTTEELFEMADKIGVNRKWIQSAGTPREHFDICKSKKEKAISFGAKVVSTREIAKIRASKSSAIPNPTNNQ